MVHLRTLVFWLVIPLWPLVARCKNSLWRQILRNRSRAWRSGRVWSLQKTWRRNNPPSPWSGLSQDSLPTYTENLDGSILLHANPYIGTCNSLLCCRIPRSAKVRQVKNIKKSPDKSGLFFMSKLK